MTQKGKYVEEIEFKNPLPLEYAQKPCSLDSSILELENLEREYSRTISRDKSKPSGLRALVQSFAGMKRDDYVWAKASSGELAQLVIANTIGKYDKKSAEIKSEIAKREVYAEKEELDKQTESIKGLYSRARGVYQQLDTNIGELQLLATSKQDISEVYEKRKKDGEKILERLLNDRSRTIKSGNAETTRELNKEIHSLQDSIRQWEHECSRTTQETKSAGQMLKETEHFLKIATKEEDAYNALLNDYTRMAAGMKMIVSAYENGDLIRAREALGSFVTLKEKHAMMKNLHEKRIGILYDLVRSATSIDYKPGTTG